jgi:predicted Rossmann-fold nucleotide-binding protein
MAAARRIVQSDFPRRRPKAPKDFRNLALPTWFYGWEPSNLFADGIAKYFSNSLREDGLLAICAGGVVYAPGSLGTTQEVFMDAAQNHYVSFGYASPMAFLGVERYERKTSHYRLLRELSAGKPWGEMLSLSDEPAEIVAFLKSHRPRPRA